MINSILTGRNLLNHHEKIQDMHATKYKKGRNQFLNSNDVTNNNYRIKSPLLLSSCNDIIKYEVPTNSKRNTRGVTRFIIL